MFRYFITFCDNSDVWSVSVVSAFYCFVHWPWQKENNTGYWIRAVLFCSSATETSFCWFGRFSQLSRHSLLYCNADHALCCYNAHLVLFAQSIAQLVQYYYGETVQFQKRLKALLFEKKYKSCHIWRVRELSPALWHCSVLDLSLGEFFISMVTTG